MKLNQPELDGARQAQRTTSVVLGVRQFPAQIWQDEKNSKLVLQAGMNEGTSSLRDEIADQMQAGMNELLERGK